MSKFNLIVVLELIIKLLNLNINIVIGSAIATALIGKGMKELAEKSPRMARKAIIPQIMV